MVSHCYTIKAHTKWSMVISENNCIQRVKIFLISQSNCRIKETFSFQRFFFMVERKNFSIDTSLSRFVVHRIIDDIYFPDMVDEQRTYFRWKCIKHEEQKERVWRKWKKENFRELKLRRIISFWLHFPMFSVDIVVCVKGKSSHK